MAGTITPLPQVKAFLNQTDATKDVWLGALQLAAESEVRSYCGRNFDQRSYVDYLDGTGQRELYVKQTPVYSVASVYYDPNGFFGDFTPSYDSTTLLTDGTDYAVRWDGTDSAGTKVSHSGVLYRVNTVWSELGRQYVPGKLYSELAPQFGSIKVSYTAGYPTAAMPQDLQYAVCLLCSYYMKTVKLGGFPLEGEKIGDYSYRLHFPMRHTEQTYPELGAARALLAKYREPAI